MAIFLPDDEKYSPSLYIESQPKIKPEFENFELPQNYEYIGEYESMLLGKIIKPKKPILSIEGFIGSGKTTTLKFIKNELLQKSICSGCTRKAMTNNCEKQIMWIDFSNFTSKVPRTVNEEIKLLYTWINREMHPAANLIVNEDEELGVFWRYLIEHHDSKQDSFTKYVAGAIIDEYANVRHPPKEPLDLYEINNRKNIRDKLKSADQDWYLRYNILFWKYIIEKYFDAKHECAFIVLDNADSLSPFLQRILKDFVNRCSIVSGPSFILLIRRDTDDKSGDADTLIDHIKHTAQIPLM